MKQEDLREYRRNDPMVGYVRHELGIAPREGIVGRLEAENERLRGLLKTVMGAYEATGHSYADTGQCDFCDYGDYLYSGHAPNCAWEAARREA